MRARTISSSVTDRLLKCPLSCSSKVHRSTSCCRRRSSIRVLGRQGNFLSWHREEKRKKKKKRFSPLPSLNFRLVGSRCAPLRYEATSRCACAQKGPVAPNPYLEQNKSSQVTTEQDLPNCDGFPVKWKPSLTCPQALRVAPCVCAECVRQFLRFGTAVINRICEPVIHRNSCRATNDRGTR